MSIEDRAQELEIREWERNNRVRPHRTYAAGEAGYGQADCQECGAPMPEQRRIDGRSCCTPCQTAIEQRVERRARWLR
jgi:RNA polymerase-binding transcription factor DksA